MNKCGVLAEMKTNFTFYKPNAAAAAPRSPKSSNLSKFRTRDNVVTHQLRHSVIVSDMYSLNVDLHLYQRDGVEIERIVCGETGGDETLQGVDGWGWK